MALAALKHFAFSKRHSSLDVWQSFSDIDQVVSFLVSFEVNNFCFFEKKEKLEKSEFCAIIKHI